MVRFLAATDDDRTSTVLCDYLEDRATEDDTVYAINSLSGDGSDPLPGDEEPDVVLEGREGLEEIEDRLDGLTTVETHQFVRGNEPAEDVRQFADEHDVDELVVGIRQHSTTERVLFGSTAQSILRTTSHPVVAIPLEPAA